MSATPSPIGEQRTEAEQPKRRRKGPRAHVWVEDGGMVSGTDDPTVARPLMLAAYADWLMPQDDTDDLFPIEKAKVQRGRIVPQAPGSECAWLWMELPADRVGRGVTTAVVWESVS